MVTDLQVDTNRLDRLFARFTDQSRAVTISSVALIVSLLSLLMAWMAVNDAKTAEIRVALQDRHITSLEGDIDVYRIRAAKLNAYLAARGIKPEEIYDE